MLTWLDHFCRRAMEACDVEKHGNDPRRAMAYMTSQFIHAAQTGRRPFDGLLDEAFYAILAPIVAPYLPEGVTFGFRDGAASERALGLILTRQTASLLSAVSCQVVRCARRTLARKSGHSTGHLCRHPTWCADIQHHSREK